MNDVMVWSIAVALVSPLLFVELWCLWTGVRGAGPIRVATLVALALFGGVVFLVGKDAIARPPVPTLVIMGGAWTLLFGFGVPLLRREFRAIPEAPRSASLRPRTLPFGPAAFRLPLLAWAAIVAALVVAGPPPPLAWIGPALGLASLLLAKPMLRIGLYEPEPLGGPDPAALADRYAAFRRTRLVGLYVLVVAMSLVMTASGGVFLLARESDPWTGWAGGLGGACIGLLGALFGTWADAQRYLLRREQAGLPPAR
jgi:hypothetical protein